MNHAESLRTSLSALYRNKLRAGLTMLGIVIGVAALTATVAIAAGARMAVQAQIDAMGSNLLFVFPGTTTQGGLRSFGGQTQSLTLEDADAIRREVPEVVALSPSSTRTVQQLVAGSLNWGTQIFTGNQEWPVVRAWPVESGVFFTEQEVRAGARSIVLGKSVAENLFPDGDAVGRSVKVKGIVFTVSGVFARKGGNAMGGDADDFAVIPFSTGQRYFSNSRFLGNILVSVDSPQSLDPAIEAITALLRQRHRLGPDKPADFSISSQREMAQQSESIAKIMTTLLTTVASISLLVGGIGIMNIMLVSVTERTREIGIRRALGARRKDVLAQFAIEAIILSALGGLIGVGLGIALSLGVEKFAGQPVVLSVASMALALVVSGAVGVLFGFYPARRAAGLDPIEALRYE